MVCTLHVRADKQRCKERTDGAMFLSHCCRMSENEMSTVITAIKQSARQHTAPVFTLRVKCLFVVQSAHNCIKAHKTVKCIVGAIGKILSDKCLL